MCMSCFLGLENGHFDVTHSPQSTSNTLETIPESFPENLRSYSQPMPYKSFQGTQFFANICNFTSPTQNQTKNIQLIVKEQTQVYKWWLHKLLSKVRGFLVFACLLLWCFTICSNPMPDIHLLTSLAMSCCVQETKLNERYFSYHVVSSPLHIHSSHRGYR
jgi:hypothetical protein